MSTRDAIMQQMIFNDVIAKRVAVLNQLRNGLKLMGLLDMICRNRELFEPLFVYKKNSLSVEKLLTHIDFDITKDEFPVCHGFFLNFLKTLDIEKIEQFLIFATGCRLLPTNKINVKFAKGLSGVGTSTCLLNITVPADIKTNEAFNEVMTAALTVSSKAFTTV